MPLPGGGTVNTTPVPDTPLSVGVSGQVIGSPRTGLRRRSIRRLRCSAFRWNWL